MWTIEGRSIDGQWHTDHVGDAADPTTWFTSREEAEDELPRLAEVLGCDVRDLRVVEIKE